MQKLHELLIQCLEHAKEHGDVTSLNFALQIIPLKHGPLFSAWLKKYTPVIPKDASTYKLNSKGSWNIDGAKAETYFSMGAQKNVTEFDVEKYIKAVITKVRKERDQDNFEIDKIRVLVSGLSELTAEERHVDSAYEPDDETMPFDVEVQGPPPAMVQQAA